MNNIIILGNKSYNNIELNDVIDHFNNNIRCNMAIPNNNNGTKTDIYILNIHLYANLLEKKYLKTKEEFIELYKEVCIKEKIEDFYNFIKNNINIINFNKQSNKNYDNFLRNLGCTYSVNNNNKVASCGYNVIFDVIASNIKPFVFGYGLSTGDRLSYYTLNNYKMNNPITRSPCHDEQNEINILMWLHNNNYIDATMCLLQDKELPTFDCNKFKPKPDILLLFLRKYGIIILENFYPETILNKIIQETDIIFNTYKNKIEIMAKEDCSNDERIFYAERYSSYIKEMYSNNTILNNIAMNYTRSKLNNKKTLINKLEYEKDKIKNSGAGWHRDSHDIQFKTIMYLSDVTEKNGNFQFIAKSSKKYIGYPTPRTPDYNTRFTDKTIEQLLKENKSCKLHNIIGNKGTIIIADTTYIHRGNIIEEGMRKAITEYYI
jgi:hypothetical protein